MSDDERKSHRHSDNEMDGSASDTDRHEKSRHKVKEKPQPISPTIPEAKHTGIDREKTCPFLIRTFIHEGIHGTFEDYIRGFPSNEVRLYAWKDVTLRELASLIGKNNDKATQRNVRISFKTVYQDSLRGGRVSVKPLGMILNHRKTPEDRKTLEELKFVAGDMLDVSVQEDTGRPSSNDRSRLHSSGSSNNYQRYSGREHGRMDRRTDSWSNKREDRFESRRVDRYRG